MAFDDCWWNVFIYLHASVTRTDRGVDREMCWWLLLYGEQYYHINQPTRIWDNNMVWQIWTKIINYNYIWKTFEGELLNLTRTTNSSQALLKLLLLYWGISIFDTNIMKMVWQIWTNVINYNDIRNIFEGELLNVARNTTFSPLKLLLLYLNISICVRPYGYAQDVNE